MAEKQAIRLDDGRRLQAVSIDNILNGDLADMFEDKIDEVRAAMRKPNVGDKPKGTITLTLEIQGEKHDGILSDYVRITKASVKAKHPEATLKGGLWERKGELMQDVTSRDAREPGLFDNTSPKRAAPAPNPTVNNEEPSGN